MQEAPRRCVRAGRDGDPAEGIALYSAADFAWAMRRIGSRDIDTTIEQLP